MKTSIMAWWLTVFFLLATTVAVQADNFYYAINSDNTITITRYAGPGGSVVIPSTIDGYSVTSIEGAFRDCTSLTSVTIPASVTSIGRQAFHGCSDLTSVTIPANVTSIGYWAFESCTSLTSITIPASVTSIGDLAFGACSSMTTIMVDAGNSFYSSADGVLFNKNKTTLIQYPGGKAGSYTILAGVTEIGDQSFVECSGLTSITIPASVTIIEYGAFLECTSLTGVYFEGNAPSFVGYSVFDGDNNVTVYYLPGTTGWRSTFGGRPTALWITPSAITVIPASLDFGSIQAGTTEELSFTVQNSGGGTLSGNASVSFPFSIISGSSYSLAAGVSQTVTVQFSPNSAGTFNQTVTFTGGGSTIRAVSGTGVEVPLPPSINSPGDASVPGPWLWPSQFTWTEVFNATGYSLYIRDLSDNTLIFNNDGGIKSGTSFALPSSYCVSGHSYRWAMTSFAGSSESTNQSSYRYFMTPSKNGNFGKELGSFEGVPSYENDGADYVSLTNYLDDGHATGRKWQCVEYVKRYYYLKKNKTDLGSGNADAFYAKAGQVPGLVGYKNGGNESPEIGDILCFNGGPAGHVAIVTNVDVTAKEVWLIQQNAKHNPYPLGIDNGTYTIQAYDSTYTCQGWLRIPTIGPVIKANGQRNNITINSTDDLSVTVQLYPGEFVGVPVDWWVVACSGSTWIYMDSAAEWKLEGAWRPVYQGGLFNLPATKIWNYRLPVGLYTFYFAVDLPMDGILNADGQILVDTVNVTVQ